MRRIGLALTTAILAGLALSACSKSDDTAPAAPERQEVSAPEAPSALPVEAPATSGAAEIKRAPDMAPLAAAIPAGFHGLWGLVPEDCTSTRGDAKGLLAIDAGKLRFYESVGTFKAVAEQAEGRLRGSFAFTGEGMEWTREMALELTEGGRALVRREFGKDAHPTQLTYRRCE